MRRALGLALTVMALAGAAGCGNNLNFKTDHRLHWVGPRARALVTTPFSLQWTFAGVPPAKFAVFVDRAPIKPGQSLRTIGSHDTACKNDPSCPDASYLAQRQVYVTTADSLNLSQVLPLTGNRDGTQVHSAVVVLLDASGHRIGESAWTREFKMKRVTI
jgi:hypothetical protein